MRRAPAAHPPSRTNPARWLRLALPALLAPAIPYGGQAAIEGVMMKGSTHAALAMRRRGGRIEVLEREVRARFPRMNTLPFVRGVFLLVDMMSLGIWALRESAHRFEQDFAAAEAEAKGEAAPAADTPAPPVSLGQQIVMVLSLVLGMLLFKVLPAVARTGIFALLAHWGIKDQIEGSVLLNQFIGNLVEGAIKFTIFIGYIWLVGRLAEIKRVFEYHGAEHIVINAYEHEPDNQSLAFIQSHTVAHPRCGTSFLVILIVLSIFLFTLLDWLLIIGGAPVSNGQPVWYLLWPLRIAGLIPLAGISYELIKAAFKCYTHPLLRPLLRFGMLFQTLTTRRPSDEQVVVSLASFNRARFLSEGIAEPPLPETPVSAS